MLNPSLSHMVPSDSILQLWLRQLALTEVPYSYQILVGLSTIGALLKRCIYVDQVEWRVYPNLSVLLVGPSGIGKDVIIGKAEKIIAQLNPKLHLAGTTIEFIKSELAKMSDPAAGYLPAKELSAFLGGRDYQKGIAKELTDLLSTGDKVIVGTKSEGRKVILRPTLTMQAGTTAEWLADLPDGSLEGGFLPRFLIMCEDYGSRHVAWVKYDNDHPTRKAAAHAGHEFVECVRELLGRYASDVLVEHEMTPTRDAEEFYRNWYCNRFNYFSEGVRAYANRSRDQMHRLAMLMAITRVHGYLEEVDYRFAATLMDKVASGIDTVVCPMLASNRRRKYK